MRSGQQGSKHSTPSCPKNKHSLLHLKNHCILKLAEINRLTCIANADKLAKLIEAGKIFHILLILLAKKLIPIQLLHRHLYYLY